jgi:hypothetical protein
MPGQAARVGHASRRTGPSDPGTSDPVRSRLHSRAAQPAVRMESQAEEHNAVVTPAAAGVGDSV